MNSYKEPPSPTNNDQETRGQNESLRSMHRHQSNGSDPARIDELERENVRLQMLVAELLIKNQQLRRAD